MVFPRTRVAVFLDGCFWHGCPDHHTVAKTNAVFWAEKVSTNRRRDADTDARLLSEGWTVVRVWEHEPIEEAARRVASTVEGRRQAAAMRRLGGESSRASIPGIDAG
jgi:DNA mismatch endonuclease (patch repair protein)